LATRTIPDSFDTFWAVYPRRQAKADARKAWERLNPSPDLLAKILAALDWQTQSQAWLKEDGQFVPLPATWIRGERWEDERNDRRAVARHGLFQRDGAASPKGYVTPCPHVPPCAATWACCYKQDQERMTRAS
jgi:hypothetical protein